jgi:small subunit ribosomal protein S20
MDGRAVLAWQPKGGSAQIIESAINPLGFSLQDGAPECYTDGLCPTQDRRYNMATSSKAKKKTVRIASGLKRVRQDVKLNAANTALRSKFRTVIKNVQKAVIAGDKAKASDLFKTAQAVIDSVADKGLFHKNKAARHKSRLSAKVKALGAPATA